MGTMRFTFRADSSHETGVGHVMRLSAIAEEAIGRGIECIFVGDLTGVPWVESRIQNLGFSKIFHSEQSMSLKTNNSVLFIDSYTIPANNNFIQKSQWLKVVGILDPETPKYDVDLHIHPGLDGSWFEHSTAELLFGPNYVPFRKSIHRADALISENVENIVIFGGGTDPTNFSLNVAKVLAKTNGYRKATFFTNYPLEIRVLHERFFAKPFGADLDEALLDANLVLTSSSTSSLEIIARGIPVGVASLVHNQETNYSILGALHLATQIGSYGSKNGNFIKEIKIEQLINDRGMRQNLVENSKNIFDLRGSFRIVNKVLESLQGI